MTTHVNKLLEAALSYARWGWFIVPVSGVSKKGTSLYRQAPKPNHIGKMPLPKDWAKVATCDPRVIKQWWDKWPQANIGVLVGRGLVVIDIDRHEDQPDGFETYEVIKEHCPPTLTNFSGGGGKQLFYKGKCVTSTLGPSVEIRGCKADGSVGFMVVVPPSRHRSGKLYEWEDRDAEIAELDDVLVGLADERKRAQHVEEKKLREQGLREGKVIDNPHNYLLGRIGSWYQQGHKEEKLLEFAFQCNERDIVPPRDEREILDMVRNVMQQPRTVYTFDDIGNRNRFENNNVDTLRYCNEQGVWYKWTGSYLRKASKAEIGELCIETLDKIKDQVPYMTIDDTSVAKKWSKQVRFSHYIHALRAWAPTSLKLRVEKVDDFDKDPDLMSCVNGTLDLRIGILREYRIKDLITQCSPVEYHPEASDPRLEQFVHEICSYKDGSKWIRDTRLEDYLQRAIGYSLTGWTDDELFWFLVGEPNAGKSTLVEALAAVMGSHCVIADPETFLHGRQASASGPSPDRASFRGARLIVSREMPGNRRINESFVNSLIDGSPMSARHLREDLITFSPIAKLWLTMNKCPAADFTQPGTKRRLCVVPFDFQPTKVTDIKKQFRHDTRLQEALLAWAVKGAKLWYEGRTLKEDVPERILRQTKEYWETQDLLAEWMEAQVEVGSQYFERAATLWQAFEDYYKIVRNIRAPVNGRKEFYDLLQAHGFVSGRGGKNVAIRRGLRLRSKKD